MRMNDNMIVDQPKKKTSLSIATRNIPLPEVEIVSTPAISNIYEDEIFPKVVDAIPTDTPVRPFDKIRIYKNGGTQRLYVYDTVSNVWNFSTLT